MILEPACRHVEGRADVQDVGVGALTEVGDGVLGTKGKNEYTNTYIP